ncbi:FecR domain-containing protein [Candidatus Daviesbacteria bacterium]|nr:FecR domain-containing protein [Candidatus Daviesbacteria bacterium]
MNKFTLPIPFLIIHLFLFFASNIFAQTINLDGTWTSELGYSFKAEKSGDSISLIVEAGKNPKLIGTVGLTGTIKGNSFVGKVYETADDCPNLGTYIPTTGIVSENTIELTYDAPKYYPERCVYSGNYETIHAVLTRVPKPSPEDLSQGEAFGITPTESWMSVKFRDPKKVNDWIMENLGDYEIKPAPISETQARDRIPQIQQGQPSSNSKARQVTESHLIPGAVIKNYQEGVMIEISKGGWVYIDPSGAVNYGTDRWRNYFDILMGTVEVETEKNTIDIKTPNTNVKSKGTHYWVSYDPKKKETTVGVYEGEVEVKTKGRNESVLVSPDGGKPGVVVVSQKLSVIKLAILGVVLVAVAGGVIWFVKGRKLKLSKKR